MNRKNFFLPGLLMLVLSFWVGTAQAAGNARAVGSSSLADWYDDLDSLYGNTVSSQTNDPFLGTAVAYKKAASDPKIKSRIDQLRTGLLKIDPPDTRADKLAFWINVYNFTALAAVVYGWPLESIRDLHWLPFRVWSQIKVQVKRQEYSLQFIEHEILRPMGQPLIHFALNCASRSCPDLLPVAYRPSTLQKQLKEQTASFLANGQKGLRYEGQSCKISSIFDWFAADFGDLDQWLKNNIAGPLHCQSSERTGFLDYDWAVNKVRGVPEE